MAITDITPEVKQAKDVASQKVLINGAALSGEMRLNAISVNIIHNKIATANIVLHDGDFFTHRVTIGENSARPCGDALTLGGQTMKALAAAAQKDRYAEFEFKLLDAA